jgi:hypothetical protein
MHTMNRLVVTVSLEQGKGGQYKPTPPIVSTFKGVVMPIKNEDLQYMPEGTYTKNAMKLYTNSDTVEVGGQFRDTYDGNIYTIIQELTHGPIHPMKRYVVEKGGMAAAHAIR